MANENREVKSDVFSMLMENKEYALQVYNAINDSDYDDPEQIEMCTLEKGISLSLRNDASFIVDMNLNLYEHQSTYNPNMPLRSLIYLADIVKEYVKNQDIFGSRRVMIPTPRFAVFYNGSGNRPAREILRLSDSFETGTDTPELELICTVYNINPGKDDGLLAKCNVLCEYSAFIEKIKYYEKLGIENSIDEAIEYCKTNNILKGFLEERGWEVRKVMTLDMTFERREEIIRRDERAEGRAEGESMTSIRTYLNCLNRGMSEEDAIAISEITPETLKTIR